MRYGFVAPHGDARTIANFAVEAEKNGWHGLFVWEPIWGVDAWVALTAAAMRTERIRLGTMLTPPSRMRPWKLASESATLDNLSGGRVTLSVGLGAVDTGFAEFNEVTDRKIRAELMDEALDIVTGLWRGQPFSYTGNHYQIRPFTFPVHPAPPIQSPRIPIWVVGAWGSEKSFARALRYDGLLPQVIDHSRETPRARQVNLSELREIQSYLKANPPLNMPFDVIIEGQTPSTDRRKGADQVAEWSAAGATWWIESLWEAPQSADGIAQITNRLQAGPPVAD